MKNRRRGAKAPLALLMVCLSTPFAMGGCTNLRSEVVAAFEAALVGYIGEIIGAFFDELPRE